MKKKKTSEKAPAVEVLNKFLTENKIRIVKNPVIIKASELKKILDGLASTSIVLDADIKLDPPAPGAKYED